MRATICDGRWRDGLIMILGRGRVNARHASYCNNFVEQKQDIFDEFWTTSPTKQCKELNENNILLCMKTSSKH